MIRIEETMNNNDFAIQLTGVSKKFRLYSKPLDRLKEALHPLKKKLHAEHWALHDISLSIRRGETVGIMGRNGAGKSTLLQLITSVLEPTGGEVRVNGRISALLELGAGFNPELTGRENVMAQAPLMGMSRGEMTARMPAIESFADIGDYIDQPVKTYSSGMFVRLAFSMSMSIDPDILIIDEALAVGDASFQEKCFRKLKEYKDRGKTFLLVSHSAGLISQLCDRVAIIEKGKIDFLGTTQDALIRYGQLMFGSKLSNDSIQTAAADCLQATPITTIAIDAFSWAKESDVDLCHLQPGFNPNERRSGNNYGLITDFRVVENGNVLAANQINIGAQVDIYMKTNFSKAVSHPRVAISINTPTGLLVHGVNSKMKHLKVPAAKSHDMRVFKFSFANRLSPGEYLISFWLMEEEISGPVRLDTRESMLILESIGLPTFNGLFDLDVDFSEISPPQNLN